MANGETRGRVTGAESGRKLLQVLLLFNAAHPLWTVGEIGKALGLTQSMVYRYVALLREVGLLDSAGGKSYRVTELTRSLSDAAVKARVPLGEAALPVLTQLRDATNETAFVSQRSGWFAYLVERVETTHPVRLLFERGQAFPLHQGAASRLLLASMSVGDRAAYFDLMGVDRKRYRPELLADSVLDALREDGVTESHEEVGEGIWSVAAAVRDESQIVAAISLAAPLFRTRAAERKDIRHRVCEAARTLSEDLLKPRSVQAGVGDPG